MKSALAVVALSLCASGVSWAQAAPPAPSKPDFRDVRFWFRLAAATDTPAKPVTQVLDALFFPAVKSGGDKAWIAAGAYTLSKFTMLYFFGTKLDEWLAAPTKSGGTSGTIKAIGGK